MCRHLHLRKFNSGTEYGDLWACLDCPFVSSTLPDKLGTMTKIDLQHTEMRNSEISSYII